MKKVTLTIGERVKAIDLLNGGKFNNSTLAVVLDDIKKLAMTAEDWEAAKLVKTPSTNGQTETWNWEEKDQEKDVDLDQGTVDALSEIIKGKSDAKELGLADGAVVTLGKKLNA